MNNLNIHIIGGKGSMGNWLNNFLLSQNLHATTSGRDHGKEHISTADLIFISVPISQANIVLKDILPIIKPTTTIIDLSSLMETTQKTLQESNRPSAHMHILFGPTITSLQNQKVVLNIIHGNLIINQLKKLLEENGAYVIEMNAPEHDKQMTHIQSLTHFMNIVLAKVLLDNHIDINGSLSTPVFLNQLSTINRVVSQNPELLSEIQINNPATIKVLKQLISEEENMAELIKQGNQKSLLKEIERIHNQLTPQKKQQVKTKKQNTNINSFNKKTNIGYLGPKGTFSHQALETISKKVTAISLPTISAIFEAVSIGRVDFGLVPAENSTEGTIRETYDLLVDLKLFVNTSTEIPIHQNLLAKQNNIKKITRVISHPQALAQTKKWLKNNMPTIDIESSPSTLSAVENLDSHTAIIGPDLAAKIYNLSVIAKNIEDNENNTTKFFLISKNMQLLKKSKHTLLFLTVFNRVGVLKDILQVFANLGINLTKIESRPSRDKKWDYHFFIEVAVAPNDTNLAQALNMLKQFCPIINVLGGIQ